MWVVLALARRIAINAARLPELIETTKRLSALRLGPASPRLSGVANNPDVKIFV
jgi:hypothetical protein